MISIIHPSRGRAFQAFNTADKWIKNAGCDVEYILSIDSDDEQKSKYLLHYHDFCKRRITLCNENTSAIEAINRGAKEAKGEILIVISDDFDCPTNWGMMVILKSGWPLKRDWIMKTSDGIQDWVITLPIMDRKYYERFGYIYHPDYKHGWSDTEMTCVAELTGRKIICDTFFPHNHYTVGGTKDQVSERADNHFEHGRKVFQDRIRRKFDLVNPSGVMTNNFYTQMINQ